jgi:hypothetical protein
MHQVWWADGNSVGKHNPWFAHVLRTGRMVVATDRGKVVGFAGHRLVWETNVVSDCFVNPDVRGKGVGTAMLEFLLPATGEFMTLASQDPKAQALYRKWGMEPVTDCPYVRGQSSETLSSTTDDSYPIPEADIHHLVVDLGCRIVRSGANSYAAITQNTVESSLVGSDDDPSQMMTTWLATVGGSVEVQLSEEHPAYRDLVWEEMDRDTLMATPGADLPDYRRVTFNGDLLAVGSS